MIAAVPSQTGSGTYKVQLAKKSATCECPDFESRGTTCKHIYAATFVMKREQNPDGSTTVTETATFSVAKRTTYPQQWSSYNAAQVNEKGKFQSLLRSKTDTAMVNEVLCKVLCHNLVVLIHEMYELGIDPVFWAEKPTVQEVVN